jgi:hypothetical protein
MDTDKHGCRKDGFIRKAGKQEHGREREERATTDGHGFGKNFEQEETERTEIGRKRTQGTQRGKRDANCANCREDGRGSGGRYVVRRIHTCWIESFRRCSNTLVMLFTIPNGSEQNSNRVTTSFYIFLFASFLAFLPAYWDHGATWKEIKSNRGTAKFQKKLKLFVLWSLPILGLIGTVFLGIEGLRSDKQTEELTIKLQPRRITPDMAVAFRKLVKDAPRGAVFFTVAGGNRDAFVFASDLFSLMKSAGYDAPGDPSNPLDFGSSVSTRSPVAEIEVGFPDPKNIPLYATRIVAALTNIGVDAKLVQDSQALGGVQITVWPKQLK